MKNQCSLEIPSVTVVAKAFRLEQRIGVCVTRGGWDHCFFHHLSVKNRRSKVLLANVAKFCYATAP